MTDPLTAAIEWADEHVSRGTVFTDADGRHVEPRWQHYDTLATAARELQQVRAGMEHWRTQCLAADDRAQGFEAERDAAIQERDRYKQDAERYQWLRERDWFDSPLCVLRDPKTVLTRGSSLGADCPSHARLDAAIDAALSAQKAGGQG